MLKLQNMGHLIIMLQLRMKVPKIISKQAIPLHHGILI
jgi:hypothetical protein